MSRATVQVYVKRFGDAITKDENNFKLPLKSMFLKINEDLQKIPLNDQDEIDMVRESVFDLEDLLAECQALSRKRTERNKRLFNCYLPGEFFYLNKTKIKLRKIKNMLQGLGKERVPSVEHTPETEPAEIRTEYQWSCGSVDTSKIYGWDDDVDEIKKVLLKDSQDGLNMVGIVGHFGTGKTALAQKIFMSEEVKDAFCLRLWVCVSPDCDPIELVWRMLDNLGFENVQEILDKKEGRDELGILLFLLHVQLLDKRYLVVLDDIWEAKEWHTNLTDEPPETKEWTDRLAYGLPKGNGGAIIVTSRVHEVARKMVGRMNIRYPGRVLGENGWLLFRSAYEEVRRPFDESLESMKDEIIRKCDGLPLALKMAGKELALSPEASQVDTSKLEADKPSNVKQGEIGSNKPQEDDRSKPSDNTSKSQAMESDKPEANEKGESQGAGTDKPLAEDISSQDGGTSKEPTNSTGKMEPQNDGTAKPNTDNIAKIAELEDLSGKSKSEDAIQPPKDEMESHILKRVIRK